MPTTPSRSNRSALTLRYIVLLYVGALIVLPFAAVVREGFAEGVGGIWTVLSAPAARDAIVLSLWTAAG